jgi:hypothetical protein
MFHIAEDKEIKEGKITDVYFQRTLQILEKKNINPWVGRSSWLNPCLLNGRVLCWLV